MNERITKTATARKPKTPKDGSNSFKRLIFLNESNMGMVASVMVKKKVLDIFRGEELLGIDENVESGQRRKKS